MMPTLNDDGSLDLTAKWGDANITNAEVFLIGQALVAWIGTTVRLGHTSPGMSLDYTHDLVSNGSIFSLLMRDVIAWTSHRKELVPDCEARIRSWIDAAGIDNELARTFDTLASQRASA